MTDHDKFDVAMRVLAMPYDGSTAGTDLRQWAAELVLGEVNPPKEPAPRTLEEMESASQSFWMGRHARNGVKTFHVSELREMETRIGDNALTETDRLVLTGLMSLVIDNVRNGRLPA